MCVAEQERIELLATEIVEIGVLLGVCDGSQPLTGPQILHLASDIKNAIKMVKLRVPGVLG